MNSWFEALFNPDLVFVRNALLAGGLSAILFGILGSLVTVRRMAGLAGAISHAVLGGIGLAIFLSARGLVPGVPPLAGALVFALLAAIVIGLVTLRAKQREDTIVNALWAIGMSLGVIFLALSPGASDPMTWLFGNILLVSDANLIMLAVLDLILIVLAWRFHAQVVLASFDPEFAQVRRVPVQGIYLVLLAIVAVAVVLVQTLVGIVMVIAMLTLPAGTAAYHVRNLAGMMIASTLWALLFNTGGQALAWQFNLPAGAVTVVLAGLIFLTGALIKFLASRQRGAPT